MIGPPVAERALRACAVIALRVASSCPDGTLYFIGPPTMHLRGTSAAGAPFARSAAVDDLVTRWHDPTWTAWVRRAPEDLGSPVTLRREGQSGPELLTPGWLLDLLREEPDRTSVLVEWGNESKQSLSLSLLPSAEVRVALAAVSGAVEL